MNYFFNILLLFRGINYFVTWQLIIFKAEKQAIEFVKSNYQRSAMLLLITLVLTNCTCDCLYNAPDIDLNTTTQVSNVSILANGCGAADGSVGSSGITTELCGVQNTTDYVKTGRWIKLPTIGSSKDAILNLNIYGSLFYCSYGYDNKNPSPVFKVYPTKAPSTLFEDGTEMVVMPNQMIILQNSGNGVAFSNNNSLANCSNNSSGFTNFLQGGCTAQNMLGLTVYIDGKEIVTLDATDTQIGKNLSSGKDISSNPLQYAITRTPDLFSVSSIPASPGVTSSTDLQNTIDNLNSTYQLSINQNYGLGRYMFVVPENVSGKIGFAIASARNADSSVGKGNYNIEVLTTPPACFVNQAAAYNQPGQRGALEMLITSTNPNYIDNALQAFSNLTQSEISEYYSELRNYIAKYAGVQINSNSQVLSDLVIPEVPSLSPITIVQSTYYSTLDKSGNIWFKVRDDYYVDNVGQYDVFASITTKKQSYVSSFINSLTKPVLESINNATTVIYHNFYNSLEFLKLIRACLVLSIVLLGFLYTLGLTQISAHDLLIRVCKIAIVSQLLSPTSWDLFNNYFFSIFTTGSDYLIAAATGDTTPDKHNLFSFVDDAFNIFFQSATWIKIATLIFDFVGILTLFVIIAVIVVYILTVVKVLISYILCILALSILIALAPIFIVLILFQRTKKFFDSWVGALADYALQSVILFVAFYLVSTLFVTMWLSIMSYDVCYGGINNHPLYINLGAITPGIPLPNIKLGCFWWFKITDNTSFYVIFLQALSLFVFIIAIRGLIGHVSAITSKITGSGAVFGIDKVASNIEKDAKKFAKEAPKIALRAVINKALQYMPSSWGEKLKSLSSKAGKIRRGGIK